MCEIPHIIQDQHWMRENFKKQTAALVCVVPVRVKENIEEL